MEDTTLLQTLRELNSNWNLILEKMSNKDDIDHILEKIKHNEDKIRELKKLKPEIFFI